MKRFWLRCGFPYRASGQQPAPFPPGICDRSRGREFFLCGLGSAHLPNDFGRVCRPGPRPAQNLPVLPLLPARNTDTRYCRHARPGSCMGVCCRRSRDGCAGFSDAGASSPILPQIEGNRSYHPGPMDQDARARAAQTRYLAARRARLHVMRAGDKMRRPILRIPWRAWPRRSLRRGTRARAARMRGEAAAGPGAGRQRYAGPNGCLGGAQTAYGRLPPAGRKSRPEGGAVPGEGGRGKQAVWGVRGRRQALAPAPAAVGSRPAQRANTRGATGARPSSRGKVPCTVRRRYCRRCKKRYTARPRGAAGARVPVNHPAHPARLNVRGLSHGRTAGPGPDFPRAPVSRSGPSRGKVRTATALRPDYGAVRERLVREILHCGECGGRRGKAGGSR